jgi:hypothetical protein
MNFLKYTNRFYITIDFLFENGLLAKFVIFIRFVFRSYYITKTDELE